MASRALALALLLPFSLGAAPFAWPTPLPTTAPAPKPTVLWNGAPATSFTLDVKPLDVTPDGDARVLVRAVLHDASGAVTHARHGTDFDWIPTRGDAQWQTGLRYGGPSAIVSLRESGPVSLRVVGNRPAIGTQTVSFDTRRMSLPHVVGSAVGPHLARIGWFPRVTSGAVRIYRLDAHGARHLAARLPVPSSSWDDPDVRPGTTARYQIVRPLLGAVNLAVHVPKELPASGVDVVRGKGAWLAFSGDPDDDASYTKLDVDEIVKTAKAAGLRYVELRLAYGAFDEMTPQAKPTIDRLIDGLTGAGVRVVGWTVPRALAYDDLARNAAVAAYRTPAGNGIAGLGVDVERGEEFMGDGPSGRAALENYLRVLREAVGHRVLLAANVEDPFLERLDQSKYPYTEIAAAADVLQPMTYWRMMGPWDTVAKTESAVTGSIERLRALTNPTIPISVGAQTTPLSKRGAPPADEIAASLTTSRKLGAIGVIFYDWNGTSPDQWQAIASVPW